MNGRLMAAELDALGKALEKPARPLLAIVAGTLVAGLSYAVLKRPEAEVVAKAA